MVDLESEPLAKAARPKRKASASDFVDELQPKKSLVAADMVDPKEELLDEEAAKVATSAIFYKKKAKSDIGSKGSLMTGARNQTTSCLLGTRSHKIKKYLRQIKRCKGWNSLN